MRSSHIRGFTLVELMMVITIIGLIAAIVLSSLSESRKEARNTATNEQIKQYQKALELVYTNDGRYPSSGDSGTTYGCLGDYPPLGDYTPSSSNSCWDAGNIRESANLATKLLPYIKMPSGTHLIGTRKGYIYRELMGGSNYQIQWILEGGPSADTKMCDFPLNKVTTESDGFGNTICIYTHAN